MTQTATLVFDLPVSLDWQVWEEEPEMMQGEAEELPIEDEIPEEEYGIEDDYDWIRRGC